VKSLSCDSLGDLYDETRTFDQAGLDAALDFLVHFEAWAPRSRFQTKCILPWSRGNREGER
jgi:hypothetical protein